MSKIADDQYFNDEEEDFAKLLEKEETLEKGTIKEGLIVSINENDGYAMVSVGSKTEGRLALSEITDEKGQLMYQKNDPIVVHVSEKGEHPSVSYKKAISQQKIQAKIEELGENYENAIIEGKIVGKNKGGYIVESQGVEYFLSRSHSSLKNDANHIGKRIKACIIRVDKENHSINISRKRFFEVNDKRQLEISKELLEATEPVLGVVRQITPFGVFVEVKGIEGLVHYSEISHKGPVNPEKYYKEGDKVYVKAIAYDEEKRRLSLSIKATIEDPWEEIQDKLKPGYAIKVVVSNIEHYGVFVDIGNDIEGFLHVSEISWDKNVSHPSHYLSVGQEIDVKIIDIDPKNRRLRVSLKQLTNRPFDVFESKHQVGDIVEGKVATLTDFGAFLNLGGVDGLLHNHDAFWDKDKKCKDHYKIGDVIKVKILKINKKDKKISLSAKHLVTSPTEEFAQRHKTDSVIQGKVVSIKDFGVFIHADGIDVLIKNEDLSPLKKDEIKIGQEITCVVVAIEKSNNKVRASVHRLERKKEKEELQAFNTSDDKMTLGDILKEKL
ncbi:30S ribosomal protein S1 [Helicobacter pylori]|uniref:30S ribosomal protein S1 n=1 Tax=Helicobacter pylori TaxID=210 RepID=UPI001AE94031|nr:30S ribosomal protein S1 [Helicobacter pylori]QTO93589.1 30S ribosomal protein S1 [Helicobacter pylori]WQU40165.1 30S ribosomal protein S1 [Helicobacter pylori]